MRSCPICGELHDDNAKFCPRRGLPIPVSTLMGVCPNCYSAVMKSMKECPGCHQVLDFASDSTPVINETSEPSSKQNDGFTHGESEQDEPVVEEHHVKVVVENHEEGATLSDKEDPQIREPEEKEKDNPPPRKVWLVVAVGLVALVAFSGIVFGVIFPPVPIIPTELPTETIMPSLTPVRISVSITSTPFHTAIPTITRSVTPVPSATISSTSTSTPVVIQFIEERVNNFREAGSFNAIAFEGNTPILLYLKDNPDRGVNDRDQLAISQRVGNLWNYSALTNGSRNEGYANSLIADIKGGLYLSSYSYEDQRIIFGIKRGGGWELQSIFPALRGKDLDGVTNVAPPIHLAVDANGFPGISFLDMANNRLMYLSPRTAAGGEWNPRLVMQGISYEGYSLPVVIGADGQPIIAFHNAISTARLPAGLQVARFNGLDWDFVTVDKETTSSKPTGLFPAMVLGGQSQIYLAYYDSYLGALKLVTFDGKNWTSPVVVDARGGQYIKMAADKNGMIHLVYYEQGSQALKYVVGNAQGFAQPVVLKSNVRFVDANNKEAKHLSIALDAAGKPWISFFDPTDMYLKVFRPATP